MRSQDSERVLPLSLHPTDAPGLELVGDSNMVLGLGPTLS